MRAASSPLVIASPMRSEARHPTRAFAACGHGGARLLAAVMTTLPRDRMRPPFVRVVIPSRLEQAQLCDDDCLQALPLRKRCAQPNCKWSSGHDLHRFMIISCVDRILGTQLCFHIKYYSVRVKLQRSYDKQNASPPLSRPISVRGRWSGVHQPFGAHMAIGTRDETASAKVRRERAKPASRPQSVRARGGHPRPPRPPRG